MGISTRSSKIELNEVHWNPTYKRKKTWEREKRGKSDCIVSRGDRLALAPHSHTNTRSAPSQQPGKSVIEFLLFRTSCAFAYLFEVLRATPLSLEPKWRNNCFWMQIANAFLHRWQTKFAIYFRSSSSSIWTKNTNFSWKTTFFSINFSLCVKNI